MEKFESSIPGLKYLSSRDDFFHSGFGFLEARRKVDGAEDLWRIHDNLYDLESFINKHPGGSEWLSMTRGTDITEAFETHHISGKAENLLEKFLVRKAVAPRAVPYKFEPNGFYRIFKTRAREALKNVDYHNPSKRSKLIADLALLITILSTIAVVTYKSWLIISISGLLMTWTVIIGHNFMHMKNNFRSYYFDVGLMSSKEWKISHALSHHLYPNTLWDLEVYGLEPMGRYFSRPYKSLGYRTFAICAHLPLYCLTFFIQAITRYYSLYAEWKKVEYDDAIPFLVPIFMSFFASSPFEAIKLWLCIVSMSSFFFSFFGFNGAHHHPEIFHDGDIVRNDLDWGLMALDAVRDRDYIDQSLFLVLSNFGLHGMHHLLPTVDHDYLSLCLPAFRETCREFGVDVESLNFWQAMKGNYQQMLRTEPRANYRGGPEGGPLRK